MGLIFSVPFVSLGNTCVLESFLSHSSFSPLVTFPDSFSLSCPPLGAVFSFRETGF